MNETNKSLRVRTNVGEDKYISVNLTSEYDTLDILSLKINQRGAYRYHTNTYGVVVGRVLANNGFGVPNAKLSLFIARDDNADIIEQVLYPYTTVGSKNSDGIRYNLLPSNQKDDCHQVVGTFPSKRMMLDDNSVIEVFDKYYTYTTRTNESGDYMFFGVPVGTYNLHMDLDISDCGKLSQRPRDFVYKGYNLEQFENPNQFKIDTELSSLPQIFSQDTTIEVKPFWGDEKEGTNIGITREDINVQYKFEPTCVFMGSIISDTPNDGINKRCVPTNRMGDMRELVTGPGTIEIIRKTVNNTVEELQIKGKQLINGNGVWCFQIPMNLDYITTDEYGNIVPTDNPDKGIPTRCEVRFRLSMDETEAESLQYKRGKVLIPNNPQILENGDIEVADYAFGSDTKDSSFKSLMWNGVYSVKSFIPRFQKSANVRTNKFTGIKNVNIHGSNNPMPYNNIRIKIPFMFWLMCNIIKLFIRIIQVINHLKVALMNLGLGLINLPYGYIGNEVCPDLEYWYFAPGMNTTAPSNTWVRRLWKWTTGKDNTCKKWQHESTCLTFKEIANTIKSNEGTNDSSVKLNTLYQYIGSGNDKLPHVLTYDELVNIVGTDNISRIIKVENIKEYHITGATNDYKLYSNWIEISTASAPLDKMSTEAKNALTNIEPKIHLTPDVDYLMQCVEMNLAQEYEVIKFDFYNDWINGTVYLPRWSRDVKYKKKRKNGKTEYITKVKGCIDDKKRSRQARKYVQQCSLMYDDDMRITTSVGCSPASLQCHKKNGMQYFSVLGSNGGAVHEHKTMLGDNVYYMKPRDGRAIMFATDIIMLGTLFDCNEYGIPSTFESLVSTTYKLPTNLAMTNVDEDGYAYVDKYEYDDEHSGPPTVSEVLNNFKCGDKNKGCTLQLLAGSGVTTTTPSYSELTEFMINRGDINSGSTIVIEHDDIFPVTEMSGVEWGYTGPDQTSSTIDRLFSPGGHFMGLACGNAETNIKSCVNLKRACEIGTTFSERLEIPVGFKEESENFDIVNYLYVTPNGVIGKDQVVDVTFRSAFATLNQNSLKTEVDPVTKHKKYVFKYLIPDSFDGTIEQKIFDNANINKLYNNRVKLEWDNYWAESNDKWLNDELLQKEILLEQGYTINRLINTKSNDYIIFRHGSIKPSDKNFLFSIDSRYSMPQYKNSFYFYFGLKEGFTALDEFRNEFFASCALSTIVGKRKDVEYTYKRSDIDFCYDVNIDVLNMTLPFSYEIREVNGERFYGETDIKNDSFVIKNVRIGLYDITVTDSNGEIAQESMKVGIDDFIVDYDITSIRHYKKEEKRKTIDEFASDFSNDGYIKGSFDVEELTPNTLGLNYSTSIKYIRKTTNLEINVGDSNWNRLYRNECFYACGYGTYEVYVHELQDGIKNGNKYLYGTFIINDGIPAPKVRLGSFNYFNEDGTTLFKGISFEAAKHLDDYEMYRTIVSVKKMGTPIRLPFNYVNSDKTFEQIYAGKPVHKINNTVHNEVCLSTNVPEGYELDFNYLTREGEYYYTVFGDGIFATPYKCYDVIDEIDENNQLTRKRYVEMTFDDTGYYCIVNNNNKTLHHAQSVNEQYEYIVEGEAEQIFVGFMVSAPLYFNPFAFKVVKSLNTNQYLAFDIQAYQNAITEESDADGNIIIYSDGEGNKNNSRLKAEITIPEFGDPILKYAYSDDKFTFRLGALNESLRDANYDIVVSNSNGELCFDSMGNFVNTGLTKDNYESLISASGMTTNTDNGTQIAEISLNENEVINNSLWCFGRVSVNSGVDNDERVFNTLKECNFIKTFKNTLSFTLEKVSLFNGVTFNNCYVRNGNYKIYEQTEDGDIKQIDNPYSKMVLKNYDYGDNVLTVKTNEKNKYRYGDVMVWEINDNPIDTVAKVITCEPKEVYFTQNEIDDKDTVYKVVFTYLKNATMSELELLDGDINDTTNEFSLVIAAKQGNQILAHTLLKDSPEMELTYDELTQLTSFEILFVANYNGIKDTGGSADKDEVLNP